MKKIVPNSAVLIPDNASCVFEGRIFSVWQWPQKMFDGSVKTFEMARRPDTVSVLAVKDGKLAVLEEEQPNLSPYFSIPIGRHDVPGETSLDAAKRELREETGLQFKNWRLLHVSQAVTKVESFYYIYLATDLIAEEAHQPEDDGEKITVMYKSYEELKDLSHHPRNRHIPTTFLQDINSLEELVSMPEFEGKEVDTVS